MAKLRYEALGPLVSGGGSRALLGLEISDEERARPVVLVPVPDEAERDPSLLERIRKETLHASSIEHPNILRVHAFTSIGERHARVVELADGESLRRVIDVARRLPPRFAAKVVADAAMGVHYGHLAGNDDGTPYVHGDLRPETLMLTFTGSIKVTGYGALCFAPKEAAEARALGRRQHIAPEQVIGGREAYTPQTDVYLLGIILYECLTGETPFASAPNLDQAVLTEPLPQLSASASPHLGPVLTRATAKKAAERFASPIALREALEAAAGGLPTNEEFARFLKEFFPESEALRAARNREIDAGIAGFARKQWEKPPAAPQTPPAAVTQPVAPAATPKPRSDRPAKAAAAPKARPMPRFTTGEMPVPSTARAKKPVAIALAVTAGLLLLIAVGVGSRTDEHSSAIPTRAELIRQQEETTPEQLDSGSEPPAITVAAAEPDASVATELAAPMPPPQGVAPAGAATLELVVEPAVDLIIDDQPVGRSPFRGPLAPGRHTVKLKNESKGISTSRVITVSESGITREEIYLAKGFVNLSAPDGAIVFVDGKKVGRAPIGEHEVYEGSHKILVTIGKAKWQESFFLKAGERMNFNVELE